MPTFFSKDLSANSVTFLFDNISPSKDVMQFPSFAINVKMDLSN